MAATKTTKTKSTKTAGKTKTSSSTSATKKVKKPTTKKTATTKASKTTKSTKATKTTKATKSTTTKTAKKKTSTKKASKNVVNVFLTDVVKQANKVQKKAQADTKVWIKKLNTQDKQLAQLTKKTIKAKGKSKTSLDKKISKLQSQMTETRTGLLAAENSMDKVATFVEWTTQLNSKPAITAYMQTSSPSRPTLVTSSTTKGKNKPEASKYSPSYQEEFSEENDDDMNFLFGEDDDEEVNR